jgi:hypothetical protein
VKEEWLKSDHFSLLLFFFWSFKIKKDRIKHTTFANTMRQVKVSCYLASDYADVFLDLYIHWNTQTGKVEVMLELIL